MIIKLIIDGGDMKPGPTIGQKLGPLGINIGKVIEEVNKSTSSFKGMKVPVELDVNPKTKNFSVSVASPPSAELLKKELKLERGSGTPHNIKVGNLSIEQVIKITKTKSQNMFVKDFKSALKTVVGSCVSLGILIENKNAKEIEKEIDKGLFDKEIKEQKTEASEEKILQLNDYFAKIKAKQDEMIKKAEEEKAAAEAAKAAATPTATTAAATTTTAATPGKIEKKEEKPAAKEKAKK